MRKVLVIGLLALAAVAAAATAVAASDRNFGVHLKGRNEIPPRPTNAQGQALFRLSDDGSSIEYKVIAANLHNLVAGHIHLGAETDNGPVVAFLVPNMPAGGGRVSGVVAEGTITAASLIGPLAGQPLSALLTAIESGNAYVNLHTNDGAAPTNTGPGDFPGGEIRGQLDE